MATPLTIGRLAATSGVNVETIRYYHRRGLLPEAVRQVGAHRRYTIEHMKRVRFIKRAQALGFTLNEVRGLLDLGDGCPCASTRARAVQKLDLIKQKIADLAAIRRRLDSLVRKCDESGGDGECPILDVLQDD
jgi:MerR family transcriptional regulator, mercuric resistance operon regulatory protein